MEFLGWIANLLFFSGGLFKDPRKTMANYLIADILYIGQYMLMGLHNAAFSMTVTCLRCLFSIFLPAKANLYSVIILTCISSGFILYNFDTVADILILLGGLSIGLACLNQDHFLNYRLFTSLSQILWIMHSLMFGVYSMIFCCSIILATNIWAILKYSDISREIISKIISFQANKI